MVPQGLIRNSLTIKGIVCDICNQRFGSKLDRVLTSDDVKRVFNNEEAELKKVPNTNKSSDLDKLAGRIIDGKSHTASRLGIEDTTVIFKSDTDTQMYEWDLHGKYPHKKIWGVV
ncbi:MAG: hypothetical protein FWE34_05405 [Defluviitaleaceae bacterium]|nr:hypothetical protein [Defluviitaleaceae bacterium]